MLEEEKPHCFRFLRDHLYVCCLKRYGLLVWTLIALDGLTGKWWAKTLSTLQNGTTLRWRRNTRSCNRMAIRSPLRVTRILPYFDATGFPNETHRSHCPRVHKRSTVNAPNYPNEQDLRPCSTRHACPGLAHASQMIALNGQPQQRLLAKRPLPITLHI